MRLLRIFFGILIFLVLYLLFRFILNFLPEFYLWRGIDIVLSSWDLFLFSLNISMFQIIHFVFGLIVFIHAQYILPEVIRSNHSVRDGQTKKPLKLFTTGHYGKVRHPMYACFMMSVLGVTISLCSLWGILLGLLIIILNMFNGIYEDRKQLPEIFGDEYTQYKNNVTRMFFTNLNMFYFLFAGILTITGLTFMFIII